MKRGWHSGSNRQRRKRSRKRKRQPPPESVSEYEYLTPSEGSTNSEYFNAEEPLEAEQQGQLLEQGQNQWLLQIDPQLNDIPEEQQKQFEEVVDQNLGNIGDRECIICFEKGSTADPLINRCGCVGPIGCFHYQCMCDNVEGLCGRPCRYCKQEFMDPRIKRWVDRRTGIKFIRFLDYDGPNAHRVLDVTQAQTNEAPNPEQADPLDLFYWLGSKDLQLNWWETNIPRLNYRPTPGDEVPDDVALHMNSCAECSQGDNYEGRGELINSCNCEDIMGIPILFHQMCLWANIIENNQQYCPRCSTPFSDPRIKRWIERATGEKFIRIMDYE